MIDPPTMAGRVVLITGGTGGIGKATAIGLLRFGRPGLNLLRARRHRNPRGRFRGWWEKSGAGGMRPTVVLQVDEGP
jgi:NAD(P)-dependent dehydrogenase (short-subunit alcohol dehydrogenase family)